MDSDLVKMEDKIRAMLAYVHNSTEWSGRDDNIAALSAAYTTQHKDNHIAWFNTWSGFPKSFGIFMRFNPATARSPFDPAQHPTAHRNWEERKLGLEQGTRKRFTIMFCHATADSVHRACANINAGSHTDWSPVIRQMCELLQADVFAFEYLGYGLTQQCTKPAAFPSEAGIYASADGCYAYLTKTLGVAPDSIVLLGESIGSGASCYLASKLTQEELGAVLLKSPIASAAHTADHMLTQIQRRLYLGGEPFGVEFDSRGEPLDKAPGAFVRTIGNDEKQNMFLNYTKVANIKVPCSIVHAENDGVTSLASAQVMSWALPYLFVPAGFEEMPKNNDECNGNVMIKEESIEIGMPLNLVVPHLWIKGDACEWPAHNYSDTQLPVLQVYAHFRAVLDKVEEWQHKGFHRFWEIKESSAVISDNEDILKETSLNSARKNRIGSYHHRATAWPRLGAERAAQACRAGPCW